MNTTSHPPKKTTIENHEDEGCRVASICSDLPKKKQKWKQSKEKQAISDACARRGVLGEKMVTGKTVGETVKRIHRNIGSFKSIFALGLEEL